jgi:hypothetical protein
MYTPIPRGINLGVRYCSVFGRREAIEEMAVCLNPLPQ